MTRRPQAAAASSTGMGGGVYVRTVLKPARAMAAKSAAQRLNVGNCEPCPSGAKVPYVTPFTRNRCAPMSRNLPWTRGLLRAARDRAAAPHEVLIGSIERRKGGTTG